MMNKDEMRVAIAFWIHPGEQYRVNDIDELPDFPNDLNAIHEAEGKLEMGNGGSQWDEYQQALWDVVNPYALFNNENLTDLRYLKNLVSATALQRAEALCRVLWPERWKEGDK